MNLKTACQLKEATFVTKVTKTKAKIIIRKNGFPQITNLGVHPPPSHGPVSETPDGSVSHCKTENCRRQWP